MVYASSDVPIDAPERPLITLVLADGEDELFELGVLPSLATRYQCGISKDDYEVVIVTGEARKPAVLRLVESLQVPAAVVGAAAGEDFQKVGALGARGAAICFLGAPGVASPGLVSSLCAAHQAYPDAVIAVPTLVLAHDGRQSFDDWLSSYGWPSNACALVQAANPEGAWLDPIDGPANVAGTRDAVWRSDSRVQLVGDAVVRLRGPSDLPARDPSSRQRVNADLVYFGLVTRPDTKVIERPARFVGRGRPRLSVVVIVHEMRREAPRTIQSLAAGYQLGMKPEDFEIVLVENGSKDRLEETSVVSSAPNVSYYYLEDAPPSPARAINHGVDRSSGEVLAIMIDGACLLSPGVLAAGTEPFRIFPSPVVATRYFSLGPGSQRQTMLEGYDRAAEDRLLRTIGWPGDGYRLFEVGSPLTFGGPEEHWFTAWFESNCLFLSRRVFDQLGGCDERFDFPGGGYLNIDLFRRACDLPDTQPVQLLGEGVFHQIHGGVTTNAPEGDVSVKRLEYERQYQSLRGFVGGAPAKSFFFWGALRTPASRAKMRG